jgi:hypothetical protein
MTKRLLLLVDLALVLVGGWLAVQLYDAWQAPGRPRTGAAVVSAPAAPADPEPGSKPSDPGVPPLTAFTTVAEKNLSSPPRAEVQAEAPRPPAPPTAPAPAAAPGPKPRLYGVVIGAREEGRAYLEDPRTRKVFGYTIGDSVADSRLERIETDRVVMRRGTEVFEVLLRDPTKPRPTPPPPPPPTPPGAQPGATPTPFQPAPGATQPFQPAPGTAPSPFQPAPGATLPFQPAAPGAPQGFPAGTLPPGTNPFAGAPAPQGGVFQPGSVGRRPPGFVPQRQPGGVPRADGESTEATE